MKKKRTLLMIVLLVFTVSCTSQPSDEFMELQEDFNIAKDNLEQAEDVIIEQETNINKLNEKIDSVSNDYDSLEEEFEVLNVENSSLTEQVATLSEDIMDLEDVEIMSSGPMSGAALIVEASNVLTYLSVNDYTELSAYVHGTEGVRLSPYQYVDTASDIVLTAADVLALASYPVTLWGAFDGSGDPINLSGVDYFSQFVYDEDYLAAPYIGQNVVLSGGNMINNITSVYPGASFVEFYFDEFDPSYGGLDWSSITVVMKDVGGEWYLVALIHGQWTI